MYGVDSSGRVRQWIILNKGGGNMAHVKTTTVRAIHFLAIPRSVGYYWQTTTFTTFTDDKGKNYYLLNGNEVSMEDGNETYIRIKKSNMDYRHTQQCKDYIKREREYYGNKISEDDTFQKGVEEYDITYDEIIRKLEDGIDRYTMYIDDAKQQREAEKANDEIRKRIKRVEEMHQKGELK